MQAYNQNFQFAADGPHMKGFHEAVLSVTDLSKAVDFYQRICGWEVIAAGASSNALKSLWKLESTDSIDEVLMRNPGEVEGYMRIVQFNDVEQKTIRSGAHVWDTGGIFDLNMRAKDLNKLYRDFEDEGWNGYGEPMRFTFGKFDVSEIIMKGPHGITFALMQRYAPPLVGYDHLDISSRVFNSSTFCEDIDVTINFFVNKLGFKIYFETDGKERPSGQNVLGIPPNINGDIEVPVYILHPNGENVGSLEFLQTKELKGRNLSALAKPPNLSILMLRFPVRDAEAYARQLQKNGVELNTAVQTLTIEPYGTMKAFSVRSPDGVWLEFLQLID